MGLTPNDVIDRTLNEWLYNAGANRPDFDILDVTVTASPATLVTRQRVDRIPPDSIVEIENELYLIQDSQRDTPSAGKTTLTVNESGYLESTAAGHTAGAKVTIDPDYPRQQLFNHLVSVIGQLYPMGLYRRTLSDVFYNENGVTILPAGTKDILSAVSEYEAGATYMRELDEGKEYRVYRQYEPPRVQFIRGGHYGENVRFVCRQDFTLPVNFSVDLTTTCGVPETLAPYLPMAVAGYALMGKEVPRVVVEEIKRMLSALGAQIPVGAVLNVGQALLGFFQTTYVAAERRRLTDLDPPRFRYVQ